MEEGEAVRTLLDYGNIVRNINKQDLEISYGLEMTDEEWVRLRDYYNGDNMNDISILNEDDFEEVLAHIREENEENDQIAS